MKLKNPKGRTEAKRPSKFERWFIAQFGKLPQDQTYDTLRQQRLVELRAEIRQLERELHDNEILHLKWEASLYTKQSSPEFDY